MNKHQQTMKLTRGLAVTLLAGMFLSPAAVQAKENNDNEAGWGQWQAIAEGYVARRRQPPQLDLPRSERRLENVQARLERLQMKKQKLLDRLAALEGTKQQKSARGVQQQLAALEKQIAMAEKRQQKFTAKRTNNKHKSNSLWLKTGDEGLYAISIAELATTLGNKQGVIRKRAKTGKLILKTGSALESEQADQAVSWHYDEASDSVLFAGVAYDTFYSDQNAYQFSMANNRSRHAKPMTVANKATKASNGNPLPFPESLKFEDEPDLYFAPWVIMDYKDADYWWWDYLYGGYKNTLNVSLDIPNPAVTGEAQLRITLWGWTDLYPGNEHNVSAELNGIPVGSSVEWDGFEQVVLVADFDQGILDPSGNNTLTLRSNYAPGTHPGQWLDQVEVDYQRMPVVRDGKLWMHAVKPGVQSVSGLTTDEVIVIESPAGDATLRRDVKVEPDGLGGWTATFKVKSEADFLLQARTTLAVPFMTADGGTNLRDAGNAVDYLVIAPRDFSDTVDALTQFRSGRFSNIKVAWIEDIYNEFSAGREDPFAVSRFITTVVNSWSSVPTTVVLVGKGSFDQKDRMNYSDAFLPIAMTTTPWGLAASDSRLLGFEDNAPFSIGRIPITNDAEGVSYVNKLVAYESATPGDEKYKAVLVADNPDIAGDFHTNSDLLEQRLLDALGFNEVTRLNHPDVNVRASLVSSSTWEAGYVSYDGHGSVHQVGNYSEKFITSGDAAMLANSALPVFTALTCAAGNFAYPGTRSLAGALVLNGTGGAVAAVAPTGLSIDTGAQLIGNALVDNLFGINSTIGLSLKDAKLSAQGNTLEFMPRIYSVVGEPAVFAR